MISKKKLIKKIFNSFILLSVMFFLVYLFSINQESINEIVSNSTDHLLNLARGSLILNTYSLDGNMYQNYDIEFPKEKRIILRVDDAGAWHYNDAVEQMTKNILARNMSVVYAVIPKDIEKDSQFLEFAETYKDNPNIEFAQHGYAHTEEEFKNLTYEQAYPLIKAGKEQMMKYMGIVPVTFIPPYNVYNDALIDSISQLNFKVISSDEDEYSSSQNIFRADYDARTYNFSNNTEVPLEKIIDDCKTGLAENNLCVVMIHPQEFLEAEKGANGIRNIDEDKYNERFIALIGQLDELGVEFTTFKNNLYPNFPEI